MVENAIEIFRSNDGSIELNVQLDQEAVWLTQKQISELFDKNIRTINEHILNVYKEGELEQEPTIRKFQIVQKEGAREVARETNTYNLDVIISVGYRVKSKRGTQFRQWATKTLKEHLVKGYTLNQKRLEKNFDEFEHAVGLIKQTLHTKALGGDESKGLLEVITGYAKTWLLLQRYDEDALDKHGITKNYLFKIFKENQELLR